MNKKEKEKKICPLLSNNQDVNCIKEQCMWYIGVEEIGGCQVIINQCSIKRLTLKLKWR